MEEKACFSMSSSTKKSEAGGGVSSVQKTFSCALCLYKDCLCSSDTVGAKWTSEFQRQVKTHGSALWKDKTAIFVF